MFEKFFCKISELLGVNLYKKYWPNGGSHWNTEHINSNNKYDLANTITLSVSHPLVIGPGERGPLANLLALMANRR